MVPPRLSRGTQMMKRHAALLARIEQQFGVSPAHACLNFGFTIPGVKSVAVSTTNAAKVKQNIDMLTTDIPADFWNALKVAGLTNDFVL